MTHHLPLATMSALVLLLVSHGPAFSQETWTEPTETTLTYQIMDGSGGKTILLDVPKPPSATAEGCVRPMRFASHGYSVSWGDGTYTPGVIAQADGACPHHNRHTYKFPGTYEVVVRTWNVGPTDQRIPLSTSTAMVTIGGGASEGTTRIEFNETAEGGAHYRLPRALLWRQELGQPMALSFRIRSPDGALLAAAEQGMTANDGNRYLPLRITAEQKEELDQALRKSAQFDATMQITGTDAEGRVVFRDTQAMAITAQRPAGTTLCPYRDYQKSGGLQLVITDAPGKKRYSYRVDWGDGVVSPDDMGIKPPGYGNFSRVSIGHVYRQPGNYTVRIYLDEARNPLPSADLFEYCEISFTAPFEK